MKKIKVIVDSASGIDRLEENHGLKVIPLKVYLDGVEYEDDGTFYERLEKANNFNTSQPSTGEFLTAYEEAKEEGYSDVIVVTIASGLSGTYQGAFLASQMIEGINIHVFDTRFLGVLEAKIALMAKEMVEEGKDVDTIIASISKVRDSHDVLIGIDTLKYLVKNGRLSVASGFLGTLLKLKPILTASKEDGKILVSEKIRTKKKANERLVELFLEMAQDEELIPYFLYTNNFEEVSSIKQELIAKDPRFTSVIMSELPPVIGLHAGPGTFGFGFYKKA